MNAYRCRTTRLLRALGALGDWALRTAVDRRVCEWAVLTQGEDER